MSDLGPGCDDLEVAATVSHLTSSQPSSWYSRDYVPHFDSKEVAQFTTFRLADVAIYNPAPGLQFAAAVDHPSSPQPLGWYSSGYLPHFDSTLVIQFITFRLADSLPQERLRHIQEALGSVPESEQDPERRKKMEHWRDAGMGCCGLKHPEVARVVQESFLKFDGERYKLIAWCIMPNHVHVFIEPKIRLGKIVQSWKSYTGRWAIERNDKLGLGIPGVELERGVHKEKKRVELELDTPRRQFWMRDYWDRFIRNEEHFRNVVNYIHENPVKAGLCSKPEDWRWSSARFFERESAENNNRGMGWKGGLE